MDSDKHSAQIERLEVVETGRRRRWSEDEKLRIVLESLQAPRQVAATARQHGISRSLLLRCRQLFRPEPKGATGQQIGFLPARVVPDSGATPGPGGPAGPRTSEWVPFPDPNLSEGVPVGNCEHPSQSPPQAPRRTQLDKSQSKTCGPLLDTLTQGPVQGPRDQVTSPRFRSA